MSDTEDLTNLAKPSSDATLTVRCIKNFEYRTCKNLVLQHVNLETSTVGDLKKLVLESRISTIYFCNIYSFFNRNSLTTWLEALFER